jgi:hypothetical protein
MSEIRTTIVKAHNLIWQQTIFGIKTTKIILNKTNKVA